VLLNPSFFAQSQLMSMAEFILPFYVAEDCAGLGTGYLALQRTARRIQRKRMSKIRRGKYNCKLRLTCKYVSESNPQLRAFLHSKYKKHAGRESSGTKTVIAEDCATGSADGGDKHLGTDGELDLYVSGSQCQPFSKMGKNGGRADERSDTMRDTVSFIMKRKPKTFIMEQVPNIKSKPHKNFWAKIIDKLKSIKTRKTKKLYKLHTQTLNCHDFGMPQSRRRLYVVGIRRDIGKAFSKFHMPKIGKHGHTAKLKTLLRKANSSVQVKDSELNNTELRNWKAVQEKLQSHQLKLPAIADFHMSKSVGCSVQSLCSPTITKTRARGQAFWLIDRIRNGSLTEGHFVKRRLDVTDYAALQGWDADSQKNYLKIGRNRFLTDAELREALGNGFNMAVFEAILQKLLLCHLDAAEAIHAEVGVPDEGSDPGTKVGPRRKIMVVRPR
jgi:DNA-cytosine methyltransferase